MRPMFQCKAPADGLNVTRIGFIGSAVELAVHISMLGSYVMLYFSKFEQITQLCCVEHIVCGD